MRDPTAKRLVAFFALAVLVIAYIIAQQPPIPEDGMQTGSTALRTAPQLISRLLPGSLVSRARSFVPAGFLQKAADTAHTSAPSPLSRTFPKSAVKMGFETFSLKDAVRNRRTIYQLTKKSSVSDERIKEIVTEAIHNVPSSFNSQSTRVVVLVKEQHDKFWQVVTEILKTHVPEANWEHTKQRMDMFAGAYGTILFYEDPEPVKDLQSKYAIYADKFPTWSEHTSAMHQYAIWTALETEGLGANLQHYNPLPDQKASEIWGVPMEWSLKAQLVFGDPAEGARENLPTKNQTPLEKRVFFHGF